MEQRNGNGTLAAELTEDWREAAIAEVLAAGVERGPSYDKLVRAIRRHRPGAATLAQRGEPDRTSLLRFLASLPGGSRPLLAGSAEVFEDGGTPPYVGWYAAAWEGEPLEVALPPGGGRHGAALYIGNDPAALRRFARAAAAFAVRPVGRALRHSNGWWPAPDLDADLGAVTWDDLVLPPALLAGLRDAVEGFAARREAFAALGFPWRRGILLIGPPGTGKTMACKAAAAALPDRPFLYVRDFRAGHSDDAIQIIFQRARELAPCILAFEDIDGLVGEWHRTVFLNELDGFGRNDGILLIASSNHPERIDQALLKRPSRFDRVFHLGLPALPERRAFCARVLGRLAAQGQLAPAVDADDLAGRVAAATEGFTPAYLKEIFVAAALRLAQDGATVLDARFADEALAQAGELRDYLRAVRDPEALAEVGEGTAALGFRR